MDITDTDTAAVNAIVKEFCNLLAQNWVKVKQEATDPEAGGKVRISVGINLNFCGKTPCGGMKLKVTRKSSQDEGMIFVEDPDQEQLPIGGEDAPAFQPKVYQLDPAKTYVENEGLEPGSTMTAGVPPRKQKKGAK